MTEFGRVCERKLIQSVYKETRKGVDSHVEVDMNKKIMEVVSSFKYEGQQYDVKIRACGDLKTFCAI